MAADSILASNYFIFSENIWDTGVICMDICELTLTAFQQILPITEPVVKKCQNDWFSPCHAQGALRVIPAFTHHSLSAANVSRTKNLSALEKHFKSG